MLSRPIAAEAIGSSAKVLKSAYCCAVVYKVDPVA